MEKSEILESLKEAIKYYFTYTPPVADSCGEIDDNPSLEFDLGNGWIADTDLSISGYERTERYDYDIPPCKVGEFSVEVLRATIYRPDGTEYCEEKNNKELTIKITF